MRRTGGIQPTVERRSAISREEGLRKPRQSAA
jgi:hypothetical protein